MSSPAALFVVVCGFVGGLGLCGCSPTAGKSWGVGGGSVTLTENGSRITYALERLTHDDRVYLVVAANRCTGVSDSGGEGKFRGKLHANDGIKIDWSCTTQDGHSGKVTIDGHEFDLTQGALFLVSTKDKPRRVDQLRVAAEQLQACSDAKKLPELAEADPRIAAFLQSCKASE